MMAAPWFGSVTTNMKTHAKVFFTDDANAPAHYLIDADGLSHKLAEDEAVSIAGDETAVGVAVLGNKDAFTGDQEQAVQFTIVEIGRRYGLAGDAAVAPAIAVVSALKNTGVAQDFTW